ncbi:IS110 family transposase [Nocardia sp. NEAU-G5]|uniref:IS110 family transposase n=1 Tax=Nocardia albiluteola TaxID=2842303 RepID=A0ABS6BD26_9NOCA|nr:IS110 family transposase [Nocardia albiluteola]MBU3068193.1 IS110 family transposase [Nocardia albiluteola]
MTESVEVVAGVDTHADTIHVAVITTIGRHVADDEFPTTPAGYQAAVAFVTGHGPLLRAGVEGTASYGTGITRALTAAGIEVREVIRPDRSARRRHGKSDPLDAYTAARLALAGHDLAVPKDEHTSVLRALLSARRSAVKARTAAINQIKALLITAPDPIREKYRKTTTSVLINTLARCRPATATDPLSAAVLTAAKALAERVLFLEKQDTHLTTQLDQLTTTINPALRAAYGVGPDTAAQLIVTAGTNPHRLTSEAAFAALCGTAPIPASSGKTQRHRLSRGGDRAGNNALHRIALVRMSSHQPTRDYVIRHTAKGHSKLEILRRLKRAIAREVFKLLTRAIAIADYHDLRPARQAKNITVTAAARHFGLWPTTISRIERGLQRDDELANTYRQWLTTA